MKGKKIPLRMCLGCKEMKPKKELVRIVKNAENEVFLDATGKKSGRGAYVCRELTCLKNAKKARRIEKALDITVREEIYITLEKQLEGINEQ